MSFAAAVCLSMHQYGAMRRYVCLCRPQNIPAKAAIQAQTSAIGSGVCGICGHPEHQLAAQHSRLLSNIQDLHHSRGVGLGSHPLQAVSHYQGAAVSSGSMLRRWPGNCDRYTGGLSCAIRSPSACTGIPVHFSSAMSAKHASCSLQQHEQCLPSSSGKLLHHENGA